MLPPSAESDEKRNSFRFILIREPTSVYAWSNEQCDQSTVRTGAAWDTSWRRSGLFETPVIESIMENYDSSKSNKDEHDKIT